MIDKHVFFCNLLTAFTSKGVLFIESTCDDNDPTHHHPISKRDAIAIANHFGLTGDDLNKVEGK